MTDQERITEKHSEEEKLLDVLASLNPAAIATGEKLSEVQIEFIRNVFWKIYDEREYSLPKKKWRRKGKARDDYDLLAYLVFTKIEAGSTRQNALETIADKFAVGYKTLEAAFDEHRSFYEEQVSNNENEFNNGTITKL